MKNTYTEILCILDRSGSMQVLQQETIDGLNIFIDQQQHADGQCNFSLVQFNHQLKLSALRTPIQTMSKLRLIDYNPYGYTALYDAIGESLQQSLQIVFKLPKLKRPDHVLVYIITDGQENCSKNYSASRVRHLIKQLSSTGIWTFEFFGANINAMASAEEIGLKAENAHSWSFDEQGIDEVTKYISNKTLNIRKNK